MRTTVGGYCALVVWSIVHTNAGRAPFDLAGAETFLSLAGAVLLAYAAILIVGGLRPTAVQDLVPATEATVTLAS